MESSNQVRSEAASQADPCPGGLKSTLNLSLILIGLILVLIGRGCDAIGARSVARAHAVVQNLKNSSEAENEAKKNVLDLKFEGMKIALEDQWDPKEDALNSEWEKKEAAFKTEWEEKEKALESIQDAVARMTRSGELSTEKEKARSKMKEEKDKALADFKTEKDKAWADYNTEKEKAEKKLTKDNDRAKTKAEREWADDQSNARNAAVSNVMKSYWYELIFTLGSIILVIGLLFAAKTGSTRETTICLIMLCIILVSIYILGVPWISSIVSTIKAMGA